MTTARLITTCFFIWLTAKSTVAQNPAIAPPAHPIYQLEERLMAGDKSALFEIAPYFDSEKYVIEYLGYHPLERTESEIAKRIVAENTLFTDAEFYITDTSTAEQFTAFLNQNIDKIVFSKLATSFLITPLDQRPVNFTIRTISPARKQELQESAPALLQLDWVTANGIDTLIEQRNALSLLIIASEFFKIRYRFDRYAFNKKEFSDLLQLLTGTEIGIEIENNAIPEQVNTYFYPIAGEDLLIYFAKYYTAYIWDEHTSVFLHAGQEIKAIGKEDLLFQMLASKNDSIAIDAYTQLTVCDPTKVTQLANRFQNEGLQSNYAIPLFPLKFLKQLVLLTDYCKTHDIDFVGSKELQSNIALLRTQLSFADRRKLEDKLIHTLTLDEITAFEYWALIHQQSWALTYSAGRILDIFYSKHWNQMLSDTQYFSCYLKKSALFDQLGIIGICNNYLVKFSGSSAPTLTQLKTFQTSDSDIQAQIDQVLQQNNNPNTAKPKGLITWVGNDHYQVNHLKKQLRALTKNVQDSSKTDDSISKILSQINYSQISTALKAIENYPFKTQWKKYAFMERDWGFFMAGDFDQKETRDTFLKLYRKHSEYELYAYYLDQAGIDYTTHQTLDYDKIYELLKYDVVVAFVGGGGGALNNEVYALVKLLELTFKTTLGFPYKLCNSNNMYACYSDKRANAWMKYMEDNKLLNQIHDEPISYHYE